MLISEDTRFEIIVSDDVSSDNAEKLLSKIHDSRFKYYRNEKNLGAHKNWEHSLALGCGQWLYLVMGRDRLHGEYISNLIEILKSADEKNITCFYDGCIKNTQIKIYDGIESMIQFLGFHHPTGTIFKRSIFEEIPNRTQYFEISDMYPENYIKHYSLLKGKGAYIMSKIYNYPDPLVDKVKIKSSVENGGDIFKMFYAPKRRTMQTLEIIDIIEEDSPEIFNKHDVNKFFRKKYNALIASVTYGWRGMCNDTIWQAHYGHNTRDVSYFEMIKNIFTVYNDTKKNLKQNVLYSFNKRVIMYYYLYYYLIYFPIKKFAKTILEPLGIWQILKAIKKFPRKN